MKIDVSAQGIPLIINADDFGLSSAVNRAVSQAHTQGVLTSASLMVNEAAADEAVAIAKAHPKLAVGLHLALVLGRAALPHHAIPHITNAQGRFSDSSPLAGLHYFFSPAARREVRREMRAQFERFAATGLPFSHVDGHTHLHMHPVVFKELIALCEEFNVRRVRIAKGEMRLSLSLDRQRWPIKLVWGIVFNWLGRWCEKQLAGRGFVQPRKVYGLLQTGDMNEPYLLGLLARMEKTPSEIYAHPLAEDADATEERHNPGGAVELQALTSQRLHAAIQQAGFRLANYHQLTTGNL